MTEQDDEAVLDVEDVDIVEVLEEADHLLAALVAAGEMLAGQPDR